MTFSGWHVRFPAVDLTGIQGVLIDLDNTLYPVTPAMEAGLEKCLAEFEREFALLSGEDFKRKYSEKRAEVVARLSPQGACRSRLFTFHSLFEELRIVQPFLSALRYESLYWESFMDAMVLAPDALAFLEICRQKSLPVCVLSDMQAHFQIRKLEKLGVSAFFRSLVTSEEAGAEKPDARIFQMALDRLQLSARDVVMVGDDFEKDIQGSRMKGIRAYQVTVSRAP